MAKTREIPTAAGQPPPGFVYVQTPPPPPGGTSGTGGGGADNDWGKWAFHVLAELKRLNNSIEELRKDLNNVTLDVVQLKVKSGIWGGVAGLVSVLVVFASSWVSKSMEKSQPSQPAGQYYAYPIQPQPQPGSYQPQPQPTQPANPQPVQPQPIKTP